ncbi:MAG: ATP-grasp domain-containing protein [Methylovulum sp.]|nr:ATP-grasp domain-containing protein [Methylovulum sp.]
MSLQPENDSILVLDGEEFSTLSIVRSLGRKGLTITVAATDDKAICRYSKYTQHFFTYPDPLTATEGFTQTIIKKLTEQNYTLLIPVTELTTLPLAKIRQQIEQRTLLALADNQALDIVTNKAKTFALAEKHGIPIPKSYHIDDLQALENCITEINYPVVIKPSRSIADQKNDIRAKLKVDYAFNAEELQQKTHNLLKYTEIILQEYFAGTGTGIELIADRGTIIHAFQHQRLHELPLTGGGSCLRQSVAVHPQLLNYAQALIKALNWHGVAMVEFKHNAENNQSCLMEINGRFWGSLPLAVAAGSDFPWFLYQMLIHQQYPQQFNSEPGHISRKIKEDLYWYIQVIFRRDNSPLIKWPTTTQLIKDFCSIFNYRHHFDAFYYKDLKPGFIELGRTGLWLYYFISGYIRKRWLKKKHLKIKQTQAIAQPLKLAKNIRFLCYGNINRSAVAECLYHQRDNKRFSVQSAGFHPKNQRPADPNMVKIAQEYHCDMSNWSSLSLTENMLNTADLIFVMEIEHIEKLTQQYPKQSRKTYLLSALDADEKSPLEISDPYGKTLDEYRRCFNQIKNFISQLNKL